jgi:hypothetical protein
MDEESLLVIQLCNLYKRSCKVTDRLKKFKKCRRPNFPEIVSEFAVRKIMNAIVPKKGDLMSHDKKKRIEVKCFASDGPISFGSEESWDWLVLVDARQAPKITVVVYVINNKDEKWKNIKVNKDTTYGQQASTGKRPRIIPTHLLKQLGKPYASVETDILTACKGQSPKIEMKNLKEDEDE